jgi:hypothetical protein
MPSKIWDTLCYVAGGVAIAGPLFIIYYYFRTVRRRLKEFRGPPGEG